MTKTKCPTCGESGEFRALAYKERREFDGRTYTGEVPARQCPHCGEMLISGPGGLAFEQALTLTLARSGAVGREGFRWLRRSAGLKSGDLAALLDVTPAQVSRWEKGRKPLERRAIALVSALAIEHVEGRTELRKVLETLAAGKKGPRSVKVEVVAAR